MPAYQHYDFDDYLNDKEQQERWETEEAERLEAEEKAV